MKFKKPELEKEFDSRHRLLKYMAHEFDLLSQDLGPIEATVTRVLETVEGSSGVHEIGRAIDFRDETRSDNGDVYTYPNALRLELLDHFNTKYERKDGKETLIWHSFKGAPFHFHLQMASSLESYLHNETIDDIMKA